MANENDKQSEERLGCHCHEDCEDHCDEYWEPDDHCKYYGGYCYNHKECPKKCKKQKKHMNPCKCCE